jgi:hypothetical protein
MPGISPSTDQLPFYPQAIVRVEQRKPGFPIEIQRPLAFGSRRTYNPADFEESVLNYKGCLAEFLSDCSFNNPGRFGNFLRKQALKLCQGFKEEKLLHPTWAFFHLSLSMASVGDIHGALPWLERALENQPSPSVAELQGREFPYGFSERLLETIRTQIDSVTTENLIRLAKLSSISSGRYNSSHAQLSVGDAGFVFNFMVNGLNHIVGSDPTFDSRQFLRSAERNCGILSQQLTKPSPTVANIFLLLSVAYLLLEDVNGAEPFYQEARSIDPGIEQRHQWVIDQFGNVASSNKSPMNPTNKQSILEWLDNFKRRKPIPRRFDI